MLQPETGALAGPALGAAVAATAAASWGGTGTIAGPGAAATGGILGTGRAVLGAGAGAVAAVGCGRATVGRVYLARIIFCELNLD